MAGQKIEFFNQTASKVIDDNAYKFSVFRIYLGLYLLVVLIAALPSATVLWSKEGFVPLASLNQTFGVFPNWLNYFDSPIQVRFFLLVMILMAVLFSIGLHRQWAAVFLWYGLTCLLNRNNMIINPSIHYIGWLLLACALIPSGEPWSVSPVKLTWQLTPVLVSGAWTLFSVGYFLSGYDKLASASWVDGSALTKIIDGPLGTWWGSTFIHWLPDWSIRGFTWLVVAMEMVCLPLSIFKKTQKWAWLIGTALQINILIFLSVPVIAMGMMAFHLFLFNTTWFSGSNKTQHSRGNLFSLSSINNNG